ncbi:MAG: DUF485 domain-containing protein [Zoogloeaceae bacterium]|jgi:uncharacterized membrane protein (DUF485 family)|nr:DUF485 domain-containing protein [Zoogloeaceae bacterium]
MKSDFYARMQARPEHVALMRAQRVQIGKSVLLALLTFAAYLLLAISAANWLARPVWAGLSVSWLWLATFWFALFIIALVFGSARAQQGLDVRLDALIREMRDAPD